MTKVKIIADSVNAATGDRLTTFLLDYPRYIHAELMTHRVFSRNAASSRAIPVAKFRQDVEQNPVIPSHWGKNQSGMAAEVELGDAEKAQARDNWLEARDVALEFHEILSNIGLHKQIANRVIEPWFHIQVLVSATEWENWFALRCSEAAHPDIMVLADAMLEAYLSSKTAWKEPGEWHLPFGDQEMPDDLMTDQRVKVCTARAARVSYKTFDGVVDYEADIKLHDRLAASGHWSPFEHPAMAMEKSEWSGNFKGWRQHRKSFSTENRKVDLAQLWEERKKSRGLKSLAV